MLTGVISVFDELRGDGEFTTDGKRFYFHCVNIADGTRSIGVGISANARRIVGHLGHDEVTDVRAIPR